VCVATSRFSALAVVSSNGTNFLGNSWVKSAVVYFTPDWTGPSGRTVRVALANGEPHTYVQQGAHQGGYFDEIAVDAINLQPGDEKIVGDASARGADASLAQDLLTGKSLPVGRNRIEAARDERNEVDRARGPVGDAPEVRIPEPADLAKNPDQAA
jgi:hypothetical protein